MEKSRAVLVGLALATLGLGACGGSDAASSGLSDDQQQAATLTMQQAQEAGVALDEECVNGIVVKLSDDGAEKIVAAGVDGSADVSAEGGALALELIDCADQGAMVDLMISSMKDSGADFDESCMREKLADADMTEMVSAGQASNLPPDLLTDIADCVNTGG